MHFLIFLALLLIIFYFVLLQVYQFMEGQNLPESFSGCENFRKLRNFAGCEILQPANFFNLLALFIFSSSLQLFVSCNPPFSAPEIKFSNLLSHAINGH